MDTYLPREGPETCLYKVQYLCSQICIAPYLPREGPETHFFLFLFLQLEQCIVTYLPREGPETLSRPRSRQAKHEYQILFNSKGAGNNFFL